MRPPSPTIWRSETASEFLANCVSRIRRKAAARDHSNHEVLGEDQGRGPEDRPAREFHRGRGEIRKSVEHEHPDGEHYRSSDQRRDEEMRRQEREQAIEEPLDRQRPRDAVEREVDARDWKPALHEEKVRRQLGEPREIGKDIDVERGAHDQRHDVKRPDPREAQSDEINGADPGGGATIVQVKDKAGECEEERDADCHVIGLVPSLPAEQAERMGNGNESSGEKPERRQRRHVRRFHSSLSGKSCPGSTGVWACRAAFRPPAAGPT